jgi:hypothetical protein
MYLCPTGMCDCNRISFFIFSPEQTIFFQFDLLFLLHATRFKTQRLHTHYTNNNNLYIYYIATDDYTADTSYNNII